MIEYQTVLENEYAISLFTEALATIDQDALQLPMGLLTRLVLCNSAFAQQFEHAGGLHDAIVSRLLDPVNNTSSLLVDALLAMSQLARMSKDVYPQLESAHVCEHLSNLIRHGDASVRARACNLIGNLCRHSEYFYSKLKKTGLITELIERCQDEDMATQKFACFALGNAGFHTDTLYKYLKAAVPVLTAHLASDDPKTRANAAGALGNFARNSNDLCSELTSAGAVEGLARIVSDHARRLKEGASEGESQKKRSGSREAAPTREESSPVKIALFSLGNLCTHSVCRERLWEHIDVADVMSIIREKSCDTAVQKYSGRIEHKYGQKT
jgi:fused-like protein